MQGIKVIIPFLLGFCCFKNSFAAEGPAQWQIRANQAAARFREAEAVRLNFLKNRNGVVLAGAALLQVYVGYQWLTDPLRRLSWSIELGDNPQAVDDFMHCKKPAALFSPLYSPMHLMIARGRPEMLKRYIQLNKLSKNDLEKAVDSKKRTILEYAIHCCKPKIVKYLIEEVSMDVNAAEDFKNIHALYQKAIKGKSAALTKSPLEDAYNRQQQLTHFCALALPRSEKQHQFFSEQADKNQEIIDLLRDHGAMTNRERFNAVLQERERAQEEAAKDLLMLKRVPEPVALKSNL